MKDYLNALQRPAQGLAVPDIPLEVLRLGLEIVGPATLMHLPLEVVEHAHRVAVTHQRIHQVRSDEPRPSCD